MLSECCKWLALFYVTSNLVLFPTNVVECGYLAGARKIAGADVCQLPEHSLNEEVRHLLFVFLGNLLCKKLVDAVLSKRKELLTINIRNNRKINRRNRSLKFKSIEKDAPMASYHLINLSFSQNIAQL